MKQKRHSLSHRPSLSLRIVAGTLVFAQAVTMQPMLILAAGEERRSEPAREPFQLPKAGNMELPKVDSPSAEPKFSKSPTDDEISQSRIFEEPLTPYQGKTFTGENEQLVSALLLVATSRSDISGVERFVREHPDSRWTLGLLTNLGIIYRMSGYWSKALTVWEQAWKLGKDATEPKTKNLADRTLGELAQLNARLGRFERLEPLFQEIKGRDVRGAGTEKVTGAKEGLWLMRNRPEDAFRCGPMALDRLRSFVSPPVPASLKIYSSRSSINGISLTQVHTLSQELGFKFQMAYRNPGAKILVPSLIHWRVGHYAALVKEENGRYLSQDPTFGNDVTAPPDAIDSEASGYFLAPEGPLPQGWRSVGDEEGNKVWGKGSAGPGDVTTPPDQTKKVKDCPPEPGMAQYNVDAARVSLMLFDNPVGYHPPRGPDINFVLHYSQRETSSTTNVTNCGAKWNLKWISYITDPSTDTTKSYGPGGGELTYTGFNSTTQSFAPQFESQNTLVKTGPSSYEQRHTDGSKEVYDLPDSNTLTRRIFRTKSIDPLGNIVTFSYDSSFRLVGVTDAIGQVTTLTYNLPADPYKVTKVTDPFGRFAVLEYDSDLHLSKITDVVGLVSQFTYGSGDFINTLTTPYGTTTFEAGEDLYARGLEVTDPLGGKERIEFINGAAFLNLDPTGAPPGFTNEFIDRRNTFYWDKKAMAEAPRDYSKARATHWLHDFDSNVASDVKESEKNPFENRVWYSYPGQSTDYGGSISVGTSSQPSNVIRLLTDTVPTQYQTYQYQYNSLGKVTKSTDLIGRVMTYVYAANNIDLLEVRNTTGTKNELLAKFTYNTQHLPLTAADAAGQVTTYTYTAQGQVKTIKNAKLQVTTFNYDTAGKGYLQNITGPVAGAVTSFTYDSFGRVRTVTDSEGYSVTTDYDALNRPTRVTYPDTTYQQIIYDRLDPDWTRDRLGRWTHTFYDALQRVAKVEDPLGQTTVYDWCNCGSLEAITDPAGNRTSWTRDVQSRLTGKTYPDGRGVTFAYENSLSRLKSMTDAKGQVTNYAYNLDNTLQLASYTNAQFATPSVGYTYDPAYNRIATMVGGTGTTIYTYNPITTTATLGAGRLASIDGPLANDTIAYTYDALGRVLTRSINAVKATLTYDTLGRMTTVVNALGTFTNAYLNNTFRLSSITYPSKGKVTFSYFPNSGDQRLSQIKSLNASSVMISQFDYTYDANGRIKTWTQANSGLTNPQRYDLGYDATDQLLAGDLKNTSTGAVLKQASYQYDLAGNRKVEQVDGNVQSANYNNLNQLTGRSAGGLMRFVGTVNEPSTVTVGSNPATTDASGNFAGFANVTTGNNTVPIVATDVNGNVKTNNYQVNVPSTAAQTLAYDLNGNLINDGTRTFEWDAVDRLIAINYTGGTNRSEFTYDGLGRRVKIVEKSGSTITSTKQFIWCGNEMCEERDATNSVKKRFFANGVQIGTTAYFYTHDHLGSIRELTNSSAVVQTRYDYDLYGRRIKTTGTLDADFGFTGHYCHAPSSLEIAPYRAYDADQGRWISRDPKGEQAGTNLYAYVKNGPIDGIDPLGLDILPTNFIGPIGVGDQRGLTAQQERALRLLVQREATLGTVGAAAKSSITFGDGLIRPFNSTFGNTVPTSSGAMDLDWFVDVEAKGGVAGRYSVIPAYITGKFLWDYYRIRDGMPIGNFWPFQDPGERVAALMLIQDVTFSDLFDDSFFQTYGVRRCP